jgi:amidase
MSKTQKELAKTSTGSSRRQFLASAVYGSIAGLAFTGCRTFGDEAALEEAAIGELLAGISSGRWTCRDLVDFYLRRISEVDRRGPSLHSVIVSNPDVHEIARTSDAQIRVAASRMALQGIPILIKDNIDTGDRMPTTAGSLALAGTRATSDAFVVRRLRENGAIILGKANLSEWANFRSFRSVSGWSAVGGQTRNPYALARTPSGSSSGSAAAVAANLCAAAIGTETNGSIVSPASACSVVGLKPTVGLVSRSGIIPIAESQDTAGPMTRTVADAAIVLGCIAGYDPRDPVTAEGAGHARADYTPFLSRDALKGKRLGVVRRFFGHHPETDRVIEGHFETLRALGAELVDPVKVPTAEPDEEDNLFVLMYEFRRGLASYLATRDSTVKVRTLADVIEFNERHADRELPVFDQSLFKMIEKVAAENPDNIKRHARLRASDIEINRVKGIEAMLAEHRLDALIGPTGGPPSPIDYVNRDRFIGGCSTMPAVAGCPHLTVPAGYVRGLPVGLSFIGARWSEGPLLGMGYAFEQAARVRRKPRFLPDADVG